MKVQKIQQKLKSSSNIINQINPGQQILSIENNNKKKQLIKTKKNFLRNIIYGFLIYFRDKRDDVREFAKKNLTEYQLQILKLPQFFFKYKPNNLGLANKNTIKQFFVENKKEKVQIFQFQKAVNLQNKINKIQLKQNQKSSDYYTQEQKLESTFPDCIQSKCNHKFQQSSSKSPDCNSSNIQSQITNQNNSTLNCDQINQLSFNSNQNNISTNLLINQDYLKKKYKKEENKINYKLITKSENQKNSELQQKYLQHFKNQLYPSKYTAKYKSIECVPNQQQVKQKKFQTEKFCYEISQQIPQNNQSSFKQINSLQQNSIKQKDPQINHNSQYLQQVSNNQVIIDINEQNRQQGQFESNFLQKNSQNSSQKNGVCEQNELKNLKKQLNDTILQEEQKNFFFENCQISQQLNLNCPISRKSGEKQSIQKTNEKNQDNKKISTILSCPKLNNSEPKCPDSDGQKKKSKEQIEQESNLRHIIEQKILRIFLIKFFRTEFLPYCFSRSRIQNTCQLLRLKNEFLKVIFSDYIENQ
ncbi:hypothetical protein PPERSA_01432 [Pseudocohnilembus persalinus]|uniref:Uncharacterized protein n=1 Tax=Pseudocohnilembus persalinus TaxID=266149 RepID=A0A0V0QH34_PSEPJ|nr:hypothetical protein PPERSA_01432 [Pseudocohnilembus persalinus]|eukprot:KRX01529.1 hypothetical protein PPERSA_01432 [Pseudocohnilembus persalinus]